MCDESDTIVIGHQNSDNTHNRQLCRSKKLGKERKGWIGTKVWLKNISFLYFTGVQEWLSKNVGYRSKKNLKLMFSHSKRSIPSPRALEVIKKKKRRGGLWRQMWHFSWLETICSMKLTETETESTPPLSRMTHTKTFPSPLYGHTQAKQTVWEHTGWRGQSIAVAVTLANILNRETTPGSIWKSSISQTFLPVWRGLGEVSSSYQVSLAVSLF